MTIGTKVKCINPISIYKDEIGTIVGIDKAYIPPITVIFEKDNNLIPDLALRFFYQSELEEIK